FFSTITLGVVTHYLTALRWLASERRIHGRIKHLRDGKAPAVVRPGTLTIRKEMALMWKVTRHFNISRLPARRRQVPGLLPLTLWTAGTRVGRLTNGKSYTEYTMLRMVATTKSWTL